MRKTSAARARKQTTKATRAVPKKPKATRATTAPPPATAAARKGAKRAVAKGMTAKRVVTATPRVTGADRVDIHIPGDAEFVRVVRLALTGIASRLPFSYDEIEDIKLAVSEACNNAIQHASGARGNGRVIIECTSSPTQLMIAVQDHGPGLQPPSVASIGTHPHAEPGEGGMGLYLMRALMDEVRVHGEPGQGTRVELVKYVNRARHA